MTGAFADRIRRQVDVEAITRDLRAVIGHTVQPADIRVWLRAEHAVGQPRPDGGVEP